MNPVDSTQTEIQFYNSKGSILTKHPGEGYFFHINATKTTMYQKQSVSFNTTSLPPLPHTYGFDPSLPSTWSAIFFFICANLKLYQLNSGSCDWKLGEQNYWKGFIFCSSSEILCRINLIIKKSQFEFSFFKAKCWPYLRELYFPTPKV